MKTPRRLPCRQKFVDEAFNFVEGLKAEPQFDAVLQQYDRKIQAGLHVFSARRLIDSGEPKQALSHFKKAWAIDPRSVWHVWYKWVQALGGALGLSGLFLAYRKTRRQVTHREQKLVVDQDGIHWM